MRHDKAQFNILLLFTLLYPVMPSYFRIFGVIGQLALMVIVLFLLLFNSKGKYPIFQGKKIDGLILVTYIWALVFVIISILYKNTYGIVTYFVPWFGIFAYYIKEIDSKEKFIRTVDAIIIVGICVSILGLIEEFSGFNLFDLLNTDNYEIEVGARLGFRRIFSFSAHPITFSLYCLFIESMILYRFFLPATKNKLILIVGYILVFAAAVCTFSRSSLILIVVSLVVYLWLLGYKSFIRRAMQIIIALILGLLVISFAFPGVGRIISSSFVLVMAVFSDSYASQLALLGYQWDPTGIADRFDLWKMVFERMPGYYLLGHGPGTALTNAFVVNSLGNRVEKTSIEVTPLLLLFRYGIFAVFFEELRNLKQISFNIKNRNIKSSWEGKLGFNKICLVLFILYFFALFTVNQTDTVRIYFIISAIFIAYNRTNAFESAVVKAENN